MAKKSGPPAEDWSLNDWLFFLVPCFGVAVNTAFFLWTWNALWLQPVMWAACLAIATHRMICDARNTRRIHVGPVCTGTVATCVAARRAATISAGGCPCDDCGRSMVADAGQWWCPDCGKVPRF